MIVAGVLRPEHRVELIEGEIVDMSPIGPEHCGDVDYLNGYCAALVPARAIVRVQGAVYLDEFSRPQPDIALLRPRADFYRSALPRPKDVLLLIEVADSSLLHDRELKIPLYAKSGIRESWLVDLVNRELVVYRQPRAGVYAKVVHHQPGQHVSPLAFPDHQLSVADLFG